MMLTKFLKLKVFKRLSRPGRSQTLDQLSVIVHETRFLVMNFYAMQLGDSLLIQHTLTHAHDHTFTSNIVFQRHCTIVDQKKNTTATDQLYSHRK